MRLFFRMGGMYILGSALVLLVRTLSAEAAMPSGGEETSRNVVLFTIDGVRKKEFLEGSHLSFVWKNWVTGQHAVVLDQCRTDNPMTISLPAYADLLSGVRQEEVRDNQFTGRLTHSTLPDRLMREAGFRASEIAVFSSWKMIERVVSQTVVGAVPFKVESGLQPGETRPKHWENARHDRDTARSLWKFLQHPVNRPRFLFVSFNDSDEWGHLNQYSAYLDAITEQDALIRQTVERLEALPEYRGRTVYVLTTDHGRGDGADWKNHAWTPPSEEIWSVVVLPEQMAGREKAVAQLRAMRCSHATLSRWMEGVLN